MQLERALVLLVDRLLARRERRGRTLRAVVLGARLVEGGTWRERVVFREALSDAGADAPRARAAAGAAARAGRVAAAGGRALRPAAAQRARALFDDGAPQRAARLREAIRQARAAAGPEAALRVLDRRSRLARARAPLGAGAVRVVRSSDPCVPRRAQPSRAARRVRPTADGRPLAVDGRAVDAVRESWLVEDRWWTDAPLRRRYWEVVTTRGDLVVLFRELDRVAAGTGSARAAES